MFCKSPLPANENMIRHHVILGRRGQMCEVWNKCSRSRLSHSQQLFGSTACVCDCSDSTVSQRQWDISQSAEMRHSSEPQDRHRELRMHHWLRETREQGFQQQQPLPHPGGEAVLVCITTRTVWAITGDWSWCSNVLYLAVCRYWNGALKPFLVSFRAVYNWLYFSK